MSAEHTLIPLTRITASSPLDGRYWPQTQEIIPFLPEGALIRSRVEVEAHYLIALSEATKRDGSPAGLVRALTPEEKAKLLQLGQNLTDDQLQQILDIEEITRHDVKAMERGMRGFLTRTNLEDITEMIHFGLTSEDVNNLAYRLMLERAREQVLIPAINTIVTSLARTAVEYKAMPMLARTHGQAAVPTTLGKEMINFAIRLDQQATGLQNVQLTGKLNGAVGNFNAHTLAAPEVDWIAFSDHFVQSLGFQPNMITTQINPPDDIIALLQAFQRVNHAVLGRHVAIY